MIITWIGNAFFLAGLGLLRYKKWYAFPISAVGEVLWIIYGASIHLWSLVAMSVIFALVALSNGYKWYRDEHPITDDEAPQYEWWTPEPDAN